MNNKITYNLKPLNYVSLKKESYIFDNNVQVILILKNNISNFTGNVKIYDMLNKTQNKYFLCSYEKTIEIIMKIKEYSCERNNE